MSPELNYKLLKILQENPDLSQRDLAQSMGVSLGKLNYCLRALIAKGFVKAGKFQRNPNKSQYTYLLTPSGIEEKAKVTLSFLHKKMAEYESLRSEIERLTQEVSGADGDDRGKRQIG